MKRPSRAAWLLTSLALGGCAGPGFDVADLPDTPIAVVARTREEAERRVELLARARERDAATTATGVARLEDITDYLGLGRTPDERRVDLMGRMALLVAREERVEPLPAATRGARPMDWSPDHRRLLFSAPREGLPQIHELDLASGEVRVLTHGPDPHPAACFGPGGRLAVARVERGPGGDPASRIYVTEPGGGEPRPVSDGPFDADPDWSPDGRVLVWSGLGPGDVEVLMAVDPAAGGPPRVLTRGREATFSPDGAWLVYSAPVRGSWKLWRMRPDGSGKHPLGQSPRRERQPAVSPDGRFVVYVSEESEGARQQLWVRMLPAATDRPLAHDHDGLAPAW